MVFVAGHIAVQRCIGCRRELSISAATQSPECTAPAKCKSIVSLSCPALSCPRISLATACEGESPNSYANDELQCHAPARFSKELRGSPLFVRTVQSTGFSCYLLRYYTGAWRVGVGSCPGWVRESQGAIELYW